MNTINKKIPLASAAVLAAVVGTIATFAVKKKPKKENFTEKFLLGSIAGVALGVVAAFLLAPTSGDKLVKGIKKSVQKNMKWLSLDGMKKISRVVPKAKTVRKKTVHNGRVRKKNSMHKQGIHVNGIKPTGE